MGHVGAPHRGSPRREYDRFRWLDSIRRTPIYATRSRLTTWRTTAGLTDAEALALAGKVAALVAAINDLYNGLVDEADNTQAQALAAALGLSVSDTYKVARLAEAAGLLVKVS